MTVKELVNKYNKLSNDENKLNLVKSVVVRTYAPILEKKVILDIQMEKTIIEEDGIKYIDDFLVNINMMFAILSLYTNLEIKSLDGKDVDNTFEVYDLLTESRIFDLILSIIGEREITELMNVKTNIESAFYNKQTVEAYIAKQITRFSEISGIMIDSGYRQLANVLEDEEKMKNILNQSSGLLDRFKILIGK